MKTGDYRRDYAAYAAALERARYDQHTGVTPELRLAPLQERYADLWTRDSIDDLTRAREEISSHFETERAALSVLLRASQPVRRSEPLSQRELARCHASRASSGRRGFAPTKCRRARPGNRASRRRELSARWFDSLRAERSPRRSLDALRRAARAGIRLLLRRQAGIAKSEP